MTDTSEITFGGIGVAPPRTAEFRKPKPGERTLGVEVLEAAFIKLTSTREGRELYGDPEKGATLEQVWRTYGLLSGKRPVCLVSTDQPKVATDAIERVIKMNSETLVETLIDLFKTQGQLAFQIVYHDGSIGHSVTLLGHDQETHRFTYHDPWPQYSLLCKDYNAAGVDAQRKDEYWSITSAELEKVIFAALVDAPLWAEYMGEKYFLTYQEFKESEFWSFFHVSESATVTQGGNRTITLKPGGFQSEIDVKVEVDQKDRLVLGTLGVKRSWAIGPPYGLNPFALDIVRSFIAALVPPPDQRAVTPLLEMMHNLGDPACAEQLVNQGPEHSPWHRAIFTYLGPSPSFGAAFQFCEVTMRNVAAEDGTQWLQTQVTTDAL